MSSTINAQLNIVNLNNNVRHPVYNGRIGVGVSPDEHLLRQPVTETVTIDNVTNFLFIQCDSQFNLVLEVDGVSIQSIVNGLFFSFSAYNHVEISAVGTPTTAPNVYAYWV